jgi:Divergent InlB B-repeat domain
MNAVKVISIAALLLFIQGCKITQIVPAEGAIVSRTGAHDCAAGQTCIIDIPGVPFSDTFTAVPNPGYRFVEWKKQSGSLCWGSTNPSCALEGISTELTSLNNDMPLLPVFEKIDLLKLLPAATRGVFQIDPDAPGAIDTSTADTTWSSSPLDVLEKYSAGMELADNAQRMVLAQLADTPDQFILLAKLGTSDVDTLSSVLDLTNAGTYRGYQRWSIDGTDLQLAKIDSVILAIAPQAALQLALDAYTGAGAAIATGPLGSYLTGLNIGQPNNVVYALPALYGAVPAPGSGTASLSQARVLSSSFSVTGDALSGSLVFYTSNASTYATKLTTQLTGYPTPAITGFGSVLAHVSLNGLSVENDLRPLLKTLILDMDTIDYTAAVVHGGNKPWLNFNVGTDPAALFVNFEFAGPTEVAAFEAAHLPPGFHLVPFRMVETDTLRHIMVLNMYQSSGGLVSGARAEWAVFVADPDSGEPRFMVVEALAESLTADSVTPGFLSFGSPVSYALNSGEIVGHVGVGTHATTYFSVNIPWPQLPSTYVPFAREFMPSNDFVFWGNAVADKTLFNSTAVNRNASVIPPGQFTFVDNSPWAAFVNEDPLHAVVYLNNQELAISPWWNLDAPYLDVSPQLRQDLINFKNGFYPLTYKAMRRQRSADWVWCPRSSLPRIPCQRLTTIFPCSILRVC